MTDPVLVGAITAGAGTVLGYVGTLTTARLTRKREDRSRDYQEKRKLYAEALRVLKEVLKHSESFNYRDTIPDDEWDADAEKRQEAIGRAWAINDELDLLAPRKVREEFYEVVNHHADIDTNDEKTDPYLILIELKKSMRKDLGVKVDD